jgi:hypothetical protein
MNGRSSGSATSAFARGCYQLFLNRTDVITPFSDRFEGTMRVEIGGGDTTVSGDLYKARPFDIR